MTNKMTQWGIGPTLAVVSIVYAVAAGVFAHGKTALAITVIPRPMIVAIGVALIAVGVPMYLASAKAVIRAFNAGELVTNGVYGLCRHPLYGAWIVCIVPGIDLILGSWIGLTTPIVMYLVFRILIAKEEKYLRVRFGERFAAYQRRVPLVLPLGWLRFDQRH